MVESWPAHVFVFHMMRNVRASGPMREQFRIPSNEEPRTEVAHSGVVDFNQHVFKSTTSERGCDARCATASWLLWFVWFVSFIWLSKTNQINQRNQMNQMNQMNQTNRSLAVPAGANCLWIWRWGILIEVKLEKP